MKTSIIKKLAALLTVSGLSLTASLTVTAQNLFVNGTAHPAENGATYSATTGYAALQVAGTSAAGLNGSYSGTNLTLSSTFTANNTAAGRGVYIYNQGTASLTDATVSTTGTIGCAAIYITGTSSLTLNGGTISTTGRQSHGIALYGASVLNADRINVSTDGAGAYGIYLTNASTGTVSNLKVTTTGTEGYGIHLDGASSMTLTNASITATTDDDGRGIWLRGRSSMTAENVEINTASSYGLHIIEGSTLALTNGRVTCVTTAVGLERTGGNFLTLNNVTVSSETGHGIAVYAYNTTATSGTQTVNISGGSVTAERNAINLSERNGNDWHLVSVSNGATLSGSNVLSVDGTFTNGGVRADFADATLNGDVTTNGISTTAVTMSQNTVLTGNLAANAESVLEMNVDNSTMTGKSIVNDNATLTVNLNNNAIWNMTDNSVLTNLGLSNSGRVIFKKDAGFKTLTTTNLSGSGIFEMNTDIAAGEADRLIVSGTSAGAHQVRITNHGVQTLGTEPALLVVETADGQATFSGTVSVGMFDYSLYQDQTDWYLSVSGTNLPPNPPTPDPGDDDDDIIIDPPPPKPPTISDGGKIVLIVPPSIGQNWFDHTKTISNHLGDLRDDKAGILEALWVRSYGAQLNIAPNMVGSGVREYQYGVDVGSDHRWNLDKDNTLITGGFVGYGRIDRTLRNGFGSSADTDNYHAGLYAIWLHECGLWADLIAKGQYADSQLSAWDASQNHMTASYGNWAGGMTLDLGKKFSFKDGWYVEPSASAGYAHFMGNDYTTGGNNVFAVNISDADLFQFRVGVAFGRTLKLRNSGVLQPYIKVAGVEQISTGGKLRASGHEWRPNFDGARAEVGGGIIWQLNADHQLSLDYEASFGDKYDKPWSLTAGYRYQF